MGEIFEVVHLALQETFALKMIRPDKVNSTFLNRFAREARAMVKLHHPNIARFYDFGEVDNCPYITMRFIRGTNLRDHLNEHRADGPKAVSLLLKIADAVQYLHDQGNIHRDLKPANILLDESGEPFLCDFGLVKNHLEEPVSLVSTAMPTLTGSEGTGLPTLQAPSEATITHQPVPQQVRGHAITMTGELWGTYPYMSPEQSRGKTNEVGRKADVWALGVIFYEMITGHRPFISADNIELLRSIQEDPVKKPSDWNPEIDARLEAIVLRCLEKSPADRYPSVGALMTELRLWLHAPPIDEQPKKLSRLWTRWLPLGLTAAIVTVLALYLLPGTPPSAANNRFDFPSWARAELAAGKSVELIDDQGKPAWDFPIIVGKNTSKIDGTADQWTIHTTNVAMVELLDDPGIDDYVLRAEIHGNNLAALPRAGLFVGQTRIDDPTGTWNYQLEATYKDDYGNYLPTPGIAPEVKRKLPPNTVKRPMPVKIERIDNEMGIVEIQIRGLNEPRQRAVPRQLKQWEFREDKPTPGGPWRQLVIEAHPRSYEVQWENRPKFTVALPLSDQILFQMLHPLAEEPNVPLQFKPRGSLGIVVEGGSATFRRVEIVPMKK